MNLYVPTGNSAAEEAAAPDALRVGQLPDCNLTLHDQAVSSKHARLLRQGDGLFLENPGSANSSYF